MDVARVPRRLGIFFTQGMVQPTTKCSSLPPTSKRLTNIHQITTPNRPNQLSLGNMQCVSELRNTVESIPLIDYSSQSQSNVLSSKERGKTIECISLSDYMQLLSS